MADYYYQGGGRTMYSDTDECYDADRHGSRRVYSHTDGYYNDADRRMPPAAYGDDCYNGGGGYGPAKQQAAVYSSEDYYSRGGYGGEQLYKREEKEHKHKERLGEMGALAGGAFALYEGHRAKKDPEHAQRHKIEAGVATAAALGAGGYAYHEHREHKEDNSNRPVPHGYYCN